MGWIALGFVFLGVVIVYSIFQDIKKDLEEQRKQQRSEEERLRKRMGL